MSDHVQQMLSIQYNHFVCLDTQIIRDHQEMFMDHHEIIWDRQASSGGHQGHQGSSDVIGDSS